MSNDKIKNESFYTDADEKTKQEIDQCLLFLYGRSFYWNNMDGDFKDGVRKGLRVKIISHLFENKQRRDAILQISSMSGDTDLTGDEHHKQRFYLL